MRDGIILISTLAPAFRQMWVDIRRAQSVNPATFQMIQIREKIVP
jgi:hypothetical protein